MYKDRLARFGFELIEYFASINNVKIEALDKIDKEEQQELEKHLEIVCSLLRKSYIKSNEGIKNGV